MPFEEVTIGACRLIRGDALEVLPCLEPVDVVITDPVWPNCEHVFPGIDTFQTCREALSYCQTQRLVLHLGIHSDPRFLQSVPKQWPFFRLCYLEYAVVGYLGRLLYDAEVAYVFGEPPPSKPGQRVIPGRCIATAHNEYPKGWGRSRAAAAPYVAQLAHPAPRHQQHLAWLMRWFGGPQVLDPFMGTGTTAIAAIRSGHTFTGVEIERAYFDLACRRIEQAYVQGDLWSPPTTQRVEQIVLL